MILSLAKKHQKKLIAPVIAGGIIFLSDHLGAPVIATSLTPIASEIVVLAILSWWARRILKAKENEAKVADKIAKDNLEGELDYFTALTNKIPDANEGAKKEAQEHLIDLVKMRAEHSRQMQKKLDENRKNATNDYEKSKIDLAEIESEIENQMKNIS
ncbi:QueT transporter family protein, partial [Cronobacter dublinensis]|uniref:QueT transporter family protein n=1 Tax=Cronobacter dublinensis TaxID=413497 RepID=UPI001412E08D